MTADPRDAAAIRVPPPLYPLLTILLGVGLQRLWPLHVVPAGATPARYWIGGLIVAGAVLGLGLLPVVLFRRTGQSELPWTPTTSIVEQGPYRFTRNPMYLHMVLVCIGMAVLLWNAWILLLTPLCAWALHRFAILREEAYLEGKFGEAYRDYMHRVRRWI